jgi:tryptophan synthase alpha chain
MTKIEKNIRTSLNEKEILLVSHVVLGYPNIEIGIQSVKEMANAGVDIIELQIPFSDPQADGPFFTKAQQDAVNNGITTKQCFDFAEKVSSKFPEINFVFMTYINIVFKYGIAKFVEKAAEVGIKGIILPDLPIEEADEYINACELYKIAPILMFTPTTTEDRMKKISQKAKGFIYCQARVGITGTHTKFGKSETEYIARCKRNTELPIAMGFGIQEKDDVDFLKGKVDIAICCTQAVKALVKNGPKGMGSFLKSLRG